MMSSLFAQRAHLPPRLLGQTSVGCRRGLKSRRKTTRTLSCRGPEGTRGPCIGDGGPCIGVGAGLDDLLGLNPRVSNDGRDRPVGDKGSLTGKNLCIEDACNGDNLGGRLDRLGNLSILVRGRCTFELEVPSVLRGRESRHYFTSRTVSAPPAETPTAGSQERFQRHTAEPQRLEAGTADSHPSEEPQRCGTSSSDPYSRSQLP
jgi:hypothetical protein